MHGKFRLTYSWKANQKKCFSFVFEGKYHISLQDIQRGDSMEGFFVTSLRAHMWRCLFSVLYGIQTYLLDLHTFHSYA